MATSVQITLIICVTLVAISALSNFSKGRKK